MTTEGDERNRRAGSDDPDLAGMRALENALGDLPTEARVPERLWAGIRERMDVAEPDVVSLEARRPAASRRFSLSLLQMVAAGVVLVLVSGTSVWLAVTGGGQTPTPVAEAGSASAAVFAAAERAFPAESLDAYRTAVVELETVLAEGRGVLGDETLQTIETSLATIDAAIEEAAEALARDPGSETLNRLLTRSMLKKIGILRHTALTIRARST